MMLGERIIVIFSVDREILKEHQVTYFFIPHFKNLESHWNPSA